MDKKKLIPIIIAIVLLIVAVFLFFNNRSKKTTYSVLEITYNGEKNEYTDLTNSLYIMVGEHKLILGSIGPYSIIFNYDKDIIFDNKTARDVEIKGGKEQKVCFEANDCFTVIYR